MLWLLACGHRRFPCRGGHRRCGRPLLRGHRGRAPSNETSASNFWSQPPGCGDRSATTTLEAGFRIDGVTGPDEYSAVADNNVYTNLMAQQNLRAAADAAARYPDLAAARHRRRGDRPMARRRRGDVHPLRRGARCPPAGRRLYRPPGLGLRRHHSTDSYPLLLHFPYFDLYRKQVVKQADLVLAMHRRTDAFTAEQKARNFAYYERLTVRDSSLSACTQAVIAAEVGHLRWPTTTLARPP